MLRIAAALSGLALLLGAAAKPKPPHYSFKRIAAGLSWPTYVTSAPDDAATLYVVEQRGTIRTVRHGRVAGTFLDIREQVLFDGERGLLGLAFHPDYAHNHLLYVDYTDSNGDTHVVEYRSENGVAVPASARELLYVQQPYANHKGGQLAFDGAGRLYVGMGDGGTNPANGPRGIGDPENRAQDPASRLGKLLRIDPLAPSASWEIVGFGLRNPWRFSFDRLTGNLWIGDVGPARFEEIDFRPAARVGIAANFGWSRFEARAWYNANVALYAGAELVSPAWSYPHRSRVGVPGDCGVIGGYVYRGRRVPAARGRYLFGDLCSGVLWSFRVGPSGRASRVVRLRGRVPALSSFGEDANGELYALDYGDGTLYALRR
jgi:glucose/arabinose dehydrogenase